MFQVRDEKTQAGEPARYAWIAAGGQLIQRQGSTLQHVPPHYVSSLAWALNLGELGMSGDSSGCHRPGGSASGIWECPGLLLNT